MRLLYGTTNSAKLQTMRETLDGLGLEIIGLRELGLPVPVIDESGKDPLENARIKAEAYFSAFEMPVFSCDSGLYIDGLEDALQPGTHIRRVGGRELSDEEMTAYYAGLAKTHGGNLTARYRNAICLITGKDRSFSRMDDSIASEPFLLVPEAHRRRVPGFPLDCISVDPTSGKYYYDLPEQGSDYSGFRRFFLEALGRCDKEHL